MHIAPRHAIGATDGSDGQEASHRAGRGVMDTDIRERTEAYINARNHHPAWQLLATRRAPLVLGCLQALFAGSQHGIPFEDALQSPADLLTQHASQSEF